VLSFALEGDGEFELDARLALDEHLWLGARRSARPAWAGLKARCPVGGSSAEIDSLRVRSQQSVFGRFAAR
jgi:hypothetical protein